MGKEFLHIFDEWADQYDASVSGQDPQYADVFFRYEEILEAVAQRVHGTVIEFGPGTGNLTKRVLEKGVEVLPVEPHDKMRALFQNRFPQLEAQEGDLLEFVTPEGQVDGFISSYVFHHLTDAEKGEALKRYAELLPVGGKVVFADTVFSSEDAKQAQIAKEKARGYVAVAEDLEREYYTTIPVLTSLFEQAGFGVTFTQMNDYVWLMDATKGGTTQ